MLQNLMISVLGIAPLIWCGEDPRVTSHDPRVGVVVHMQATDIGCSTFLVGKKCVVTAGHCQALMKWAKFDSHQSLQNIYEFEKVIDYAYTSNMMIDWAVGRLKSNPVTGLYPGDVHGYFKIADLETVERVTTGDSIRVTGYSSGKGVVESTGLVLNTLKGFGLTHSAGTERGNSGSVITLEKTGEAIGVHTGSYGCHPEQGIPQNSAAVILGKLRSAIQECEKTELP